MRKSWLGVCIAAVSLICGATNAYAGQWIQEGSEWKYQRAMGDFIHHRSFSSSGSLGSIVLDDSGYSLPFYIDGNGDGIAESYVFDDNGYMVRNVTSGYVRVNSEGFCVDSDGKVYTKKVPQGVIDPTIGRGLIKQEIINLLLKDTGYLAQNFNIDYDLETQEQSEHFVIDRTTSFPTADIVNDIVYRIGGTYAGIGRNFFTKTDVTYVDFIAAFGVPVSTNIQRSWDWLGNYYFDHYYEYIWILQDQPQVKLTVVQDINSSKFYTITLEAE